MINVFSENGLISEPDVSSNTPYREVKAFRPQGDLKFQSFLKSKEKLPYEFNCCIEDFLKGTLFENQSEEFKENTPFEDAPF